MHCVVSVKDGKKRDLWSLRWTGKCPPQLCPIMVHFGHVKEDFSCLKATDCLLADSSALKKEEQIAAQTSCPLQPTAMTSTTHPRALSKLLVLANPGAIHKREETYHLRKIVRHPLSSGPPLSQPSHQAGTPTSHNHWLFLFAIAGLVLSAF